MSHPRIAAVASAIAASIVTFLVLSRWRLAGTLTGAVIIPLVYTLVSHWSSQSVDHMAKWLRRRLPRGGRAEELTRVSAPAPAPVGTLGDESQVVSSGAGAESQAPTRRARRTQWLLIGFASLALAVSVYALASRGAGEKVIVHDIVVQKVITATTQAKKSSLSASNGGAAAATAPATAGMSMSSTTVTTTHTSQTAQTGQPPSTTIAPAITTTSLPASSTTTVAPNTPTSGP
jgi:hypothetical protein